MIPYKETATYHLYHFLHCLHGAAAYRPCHQVSFVGGSHYALLILLDCLTLKELQPNTEITFKHVLSGVKM